MLRGLGHLGGLPPPFSATRRLPAALRLLRRQTTCSLATARVMSPAIISASLASPDTGRPGQTMPPTGCRLV
eukprot:273636-Chlamydomonas_euryale.AAC.5